VEEERRGEGEGLGILGGFAIATGNQAAMWSVVVVLAVKWLEPYISHNARMCPTWAGLFSQRVSRFSDGFVVFFFCFVGFLSGFPVPSRFLKFFKI
jgi:hypothetical protein